MRSSGIQRARVGDLDIAYETFGNAGGPPLLLVPAPIKRDYIRVSPLPDARTVMESLPLWIEHYNSLHPHKALGYRSPREFIREQIRT